MLETAGLTVHQPNSTVYVAREADYYSASAVEHPWCIVQPRSANEVSLAVKTLLHAGANWAVRSGGHTAWGASADSKTVGLFFFFFGFSFPLPSYRLARKKKGVA